MIWMLAVLAFGAAFTIAAFCAGTKNTTYLSLTLLVGFFVSSIGQPTFGTLTPWAWFALVDFSLLLIVRKWANKRRHIALIAYLLFASLSTNVIYGIAMLAGFDFTPDQRFVYGSILNGLVYLQFIAVGWGVYDDRREFKRMGLFDHGADHHRPVHHHADRRPDR